MGELLIVIAFLGVLGIGAWVVERPRCRTSDLHADDWMGEHGMRR